MINFLTTLFKGLKTIRIPFPRDLFGEEISRNLLPAVGYACNILEIVSEMLMNASIVGEQGQFFKKTFNLIRDDESNERVVEDLCSAEWYRATLHKIKQMPGIRKDVVLLGLLLSYDAAVVNLKSGSSATPLYISIGNVSHSELTRNSENVSFVGFFPKHAVRRTKQTLPTI